VTFRPLDGLVAIGGGFHDVSLYPQRHGHGMPERRLVIDDKNWSVPAVPTRERPPEWSQSNPLRVQFDQQNTRSTELGKVGDSYGLDLPLRTQRVPTPYLDYRRG
jgi:hypothetical protein